MKFKSLKGKLMKNILHVKCKIATVIKIILEKTLTHTFFTEIQYFDIS